MQNDIHAVVTPVLAPAVAAVALGQVVDEYRIKGQYTEELEKFLTDVAVRVQAVINQVAHELIAGGGVR